MLIMLQFTIVNTGWKIAEGGVALSDLGWRSVLSTAYASHFFGVLFALGVSMIVASLLLRASTALVLLLIFIVLAAPEFFLPLLSPPDAGADLPRWLAALAIPGPRPDAFILYTPVPWLGMTLCGLLLGRFLIRSPARFQTMLIPAGVICLITFAAGIGLSALISEPASLTEAFYLRRYPPHILLLLYAAGVNLVILALLSKYDAGLPDRVLICFGRSALMFYTVHLFVFTGLIRMSSLEPTLANGIFLSLLCLTLMYPLCELYQRKLRPALRGALRWCFAAGAERRSRGGG